MVLRGGGACCRSATRTISGRILTALVRHLSTSNVPDDARAHPLLKPSCCLRVRDWCCPHRRPLRTGSIPSECNAAFRHSVDQLPRRHALPWQQSLASEFQPILGASQQRHWRRRGSNHSRAKLQLRSWHLHQLQRRPEASHRAVLSWICALVCSAFGWRSICGPLSHFFTKCGFAPRRNQRHRGSAHRVRRRVRSVPPVLHLLRRQRTHLMPRNLLQPHTSAPWAMAAHGRRVPRRLRQQKRSSAHQAPAPHFLLWGDSSVTPGIAFATSSDLLSFSTINTSFIAPRPLLLRLVSKLPLALLISPCTGSTSLVVEPQATGREWTSSSPAQRRQPSFPVQLCDCEQPPRLYILRLLQRWLGHHQQRRAFHPAAITGSARTAAVFLVFQYLLSSPNCMQHHFLHLL
jgi:hypothetical protein